jgi:hypothetical protein
MPRRKSLWGEPRLWDLPPILEQPLRIDAPVDELLRARFDAALYYFGIAPPRSEEGKRRLMVAFAIIFPGFRLDEAARPGRARVTDEQKADLFAWIDAHRTSIRKTNSAIVRNKKAEILTRFPWLTTAGKGSGVDGILNRISEGKAALSAVQERRRLHAVLLGGGRLQALRVAGFQVRPQGFAFLSRDPEPKK